MIQVIKTWQDQKLVFSFRAESEATTLTTSPRGQEVNDLMAVWLVQASLPHSGVLMTAPGGRTHLRYTDRKWNLRHIQADNDVRAEEHVEPQRGRNIKRLTVNLSNRDVSSSPPL